LQPIVVDISSGEEPPCQKDSASEVPEDVEVPINALITLRDLDLRALEGLSALIDAPVIPQDLQEPVVAASVIGSSLESPAVTSATANLPSKGACLPEPTDASSAAAPPSESVNPKEPTFASPADNVPPSEGRTFRSRSVLHRLSPLLSQDRYVLPPRSFLFFSVLLYSHASLQGLNLSELLAFDLASIGSAILEANDPQPDSTRVASQLLYVKDLLSGSIDALVQDSSAVKQILEEIISQLPVALQVKLLPAGHLPSFRARVAQARHRIETRRSQTPLRANIVERCRSVNEKKDVLNAKADTSAPTQRLLLLEKDLEDLKARVWATEQRIQEEKDLIASSKWEAEALTAQLKVDLAELSALSKQVMPGVDEEDEAVIAEVDHVHLDVIAAIDEFLQQACSFNR
jgi:hypothetical protein